MSASTKTDVLRTEFVERRRTTCSEKLGCHDQSTELLIHALAQLTDHVATKFPAETPRRGAL
jgi:hypothetical protein